MTQYLTFRDLRAKIGGRARSSVYIDVEAGRLPRPIKLGGRNYWVEEEVDACLLSQRTSAPDIARQTDDRGAE